MQRSKEQLLQTEKTDNKGIKPRPHSIPFAQNLRGPAAELRGPSSLEPTPVIRALLAINSYIQNEWVSEWVEFNAPHDTV